MKYLGVDYGSKRIGVAVSNEDGSVAFPKKVLKNNKDWITTLLLLCAEENIDGGVVFGESKDFAMKENLIMKEVHKDIKSLQTTSSLSIFLQPEFMTSRQANRFQKEDAMHDARAAAIILQTFLDKK